jgi:hypothetical protein
MTVLSRVLVRCGVCQVESEQTSLLSMFVADRYLDLQSTGWEFVYAVQRCPSCGYCASDLREAPPEADSTVRSREYQDLLREENDSLAARFECQALVLAACGDELGGADALVRAALAYEVAKRNAKAATLRRSAVEFLLREKGRGTQIVRDSDAWDSILIVDLLRRAGPSTRLGPDRQRTSVIKRVRAAVYRLRSRPHLGRGRHLLFDGRCSPRAKPLRPCATSPEARPENACLSIVGQRHCPERDRSDCSVQWPSRRSSSVGRATHS